MPQSFDSGRPINSHYRYESASMNDHEYEYGDGHGQGFTPVTKRPSGGTSKWLKYGLPSLLLLIVAGAVAGIVIHKHNSDSSTSSSGGGNGTSSGGGGGGGTSAGDLGVFYTATDAYGLPVYPTTTNTAVFGTPTFLANAAASWPADTTTFASPTPTAVRADHPRLVAPKYKWDALPDMIAKDPYLAAWNETIFTNATLHLTQDPLNYDIDGGLGGSGVLDIARQTKLRIKNLAYAYRISNETKYADRAYRELQNAAGNTTNPFGTSPDNWNSEHFLDLAEFTAAFAIGYDWLYDYWSETQREAIMWSILNLGIHWGLQAYTNPAFFYGWWRTAGNNNGNWNCVCNSGLTLGALAIVDADPTGNAALLLSYTVPNAVAGCVYGPSSDGTWSETPNYWYFGTTAHAEMSSSLLSATGSEYGLLTTNPTTNFTALYHMYVTGMTSLFNYGDHGPNKYSTNANAMMFYGSYFKIPQYLLHQRDRIDAPEPQGLFWYDPSVSGAFWDQMPLDHYFDDGLDQWASMRSSWTDDTGLYLAMKAGNHTGHQAHGDLDAGDFVLDAMGQRWAGELGSGNYLSDGYFSNETQSSLRWYYYRKRTEGQNTIVVDKQNQKVDALPTTNYGSSGTKQDGGTTVFDVPSDSTAFFTCDLTTTYFGTSINRGVRLINGRKQVLLQDDITGASVTSEWRMHTNATVTIDGTTATLKLGGKTLIATILNAPSGVVFTSGPAVRYSTDPILPSDAASQDQPNDGVTVLMIEIPTGTNSIQVLFNPQWDGMSSSDFVTPPNVPVSGWTLTSHN